MILNAEVGKVVDVVLEELVADRGLPWPRAQPVIGEGERGQLARRRGRRVQELLDDRVIARGGNDLHVGVVREAEPQLGVEATAPAHARGKAVAETLGR